MTSCYGKWSLIALAVLIVFLDLVTAGKVLQHQVGDLSPPEIEDALLVSVSTTQIHTLPMNADCGKQCPLVQELNEYRRANVPETPGFATQIFERLFPYGPAANALLATLYISGPPSIISLSSRLYASSLIGVHRFPPRIMPAQH